MDLDQVLNDAPEVIAPPEKPPEGEQKHDGPKATRRAHLEKEQAARAEGEGKVRDPETGKFVPKEEEKAEVKAEKPPEQDMTPKEKAAFAKAADESRKRQERDQEVAQLRAEIAAMRQQPKPAAEPPKTFYDDPEAHVKKLEAGQEQMARDMRQALMNVQLNALEAVARGKHDDYDEKATMFAEMVKESPYLWQEALKSGNPAEYAYKAAKNKTELQQAGSIDTLKSNLEKELRLKIEQEMKDKQEADRKLRDDLPPSLSDARGVSQHRPVWNGPTTLDSILSGK